LSTNEQELEQFIYEEWRLISPDAVVSAVSSINCQMLKMVGNGGDHIPY